MHQHPGLLSASQTQQPTGLARWERLIQRSCTQTWAGHTELAMFSLRQALGLAQDLLHGGPSAAASSHCVAALVVSHHNLADLYANAQLPDLAARHLCQAHLTLLELMHVQTARTSPALRQAAWQHSRETHAGLLLFQRTWGPHPDITRLLNAGPSPADTPARQLH